MGTPSSLGSLDLRERVVVAVETGGIARNRAAARSGGAISTTVNWVKAFRQTGSLSATPSAKPAQSSSGCQNTRPASTPWNRRSQNSNICCARHTREPKRPFAQPSAYS